MAEKSFLRYQKLQHEDQQDLTGGNANRIRELFYTLKERTPLLKSCSCGTSMQLMLRTVIFARKVNISNVPVLNCSRCGRNEVVPGIKSDVGKLVGQLGSAPAPCTISFDQQHEWAGVLSSAGSQAQPLQAAAIARAAEERTNQLLDLWLLASSLGDGNWIEELQGRLSQLIAPYIS
jgi:hypothetical protein